MSADNNTPSPDSKSADRRHIVLPDPVAFRHLEEDFNTRLVQRKGVLHGYEIYLVEQWACSRDSPTLVIVAYTGDPAHSITVGVLSFPTSEQSWTDRQKAYFAATRQYHARLKETPLGELMVTNLSNFPSALTVIPVPQGDIRKYRQAFIVNEDLKRLGCSGRSGLTLSDPTPATQAKFLSTYKTHDRVPLVDAVLQLILLCQKALYIFTVLDEQFIDGLLCDKTERAIGDWWTEFGSDYYGVEPADGILGPTTVAALLGMLIGARNRLASWGAPVTKDVFDLDMTKRAIAYFQRSNKLPITRRLDRQTISKLHSATAKAAAGEKWGVQKAVKSTVAEFGRRGEILSGLVGSKDRAGISEIENADIQRFRALAYGETARWLWQGRPRKSSIDHHTLPNPTDLNGILHKLHDEELNKTPEKKLRPKYSESDLENDASPRRSIETDAGTLITRLSMPSVIAPDGLSDRDAGRRAVLRSVADRVSDARSGLGRIRTAVGSGIKGHIPRQSKDEGSEGPASGVSGLAQLTGNSSGQPGIARAFTWKNKPAQYLQAFQNKAAADATDDAPPGGKPSAARDVAFTHRGRDLLRVASIDDDKSSSRTVSMTASSMDDSDVPMVIGTSEYPTDALLPRLQRRHSFSSPDTSQHDFADGHWPRQLSFSLAEEAVLDWDNLLEDYDEISDTAAVQAAAERAAAFTYARVASLGSQFQSRLTDQVAKVGKLNESFEQRNEEIRATHEQLDDAYQRVKARSQDLLAEERVRITEAIRDVEGLVAKLDYEINGLEFKVRDVEDGVAQFEAQVLEIEQRAEELKTQLSTESWLHWLVRTLTGIGTGPNIVRESAR